MNPAAANPLRLARLLHASFWASAIALALAFAAGGGWAIQHGYGDWHVMSDASTRLGTRFLIDPSERWQIFAYLPATAYLFAPLALLPMRVGFVANGLLMVLCAAAAGLIAARVFGLHRLAGIALCVTWPPVVYASAIMGQNASLGLLLTMLSIAGTATRSPWLTALPIGLLLYKPTYAVPLVGVLVIRKAWRECAIVATCALGWYLAGVAAAGGDWSWPAAWWRLIVNYAPGDLAFNGPLSVSATSSLLRAGAPAGVVVAALVVVGALAYVAIVRSGPVEGVTGATLVALAWSPHAWAYDAALALPMLAFVIARLHLPARTGVLFAVYGMAAGFFFSRVLGFDPLLLVTVGGSSLWILFVLVGFRRSSDAVVSPAAAARA